MSEELYIPREDTKLLIECVKEQVPKYANVLDMGTGTGAIVGELIKKTKNVVGVDINPLAIEYCRKKYPNVKFILSNLFEDVSGKFDVITFNPPYLPEDEGDDLETKLQVSGGVQGHELLFKFLKQAKKHLKKDGFILTVFSTFSKPEEILEEAKKLGYDYEILKSKHIFFETIYCVKFLNKN